LFAACDKFCLNIIITNISVWHRPISDRNKYRFLLSSAYSLHLFVYYLRTYTSLVDIKKQTHDNVGLKSNLGWGAYWVSYAKAR